MQFDSRFWNGFVREVVGFLLIGVVFLGIREWFFDLPTPPLLFILMPFLAALFGLDRGMRAHIPTLPKLLWFVLGGWLLARLLPPEFRLIGSPVGVGTWGIFVLVSLFKVGQGDATRQDPDNAAS